jgi:hypothetical protein
VPNTSTYVFPGTRFQNTYIYPRKKSFRKKFGKKINQNCLIQNQYRKKFRKNIPKEMREIEDNFYGIDYEFKGISFDQKFSFGDLGENTIKIRTKKRLLLNKSDWTLIINRKKEIELFETKKLAEFVRKNWDLVQKRTIEKKKQYNSHIIHLDDLFRNEDIVSIKTHIDSLEFANTLEDLTIQTIDYSQRICLLNFLF